MNHGSIIVGDVSKNASERTKKTKKNPKGKFKVWRETRQQQLKKKKKNTVKDTKRQHDYPCTSNSTKIDMFQSKKPFNKYLKCFF